MNNELNNAPRSWAGAMRLAALKAKQETALSRDQINDEPAINYSQLIQIIAVIAGLKVSIEQI